MKKVLIIVDMQNDFIDGSLANKSAQEIVPGICELVKSGSFDNIIFTRDTHTENYLSTPEGLALPVEHCIKYTDGWNVSDEIFTAAERVSAKKSFINKPTFGYMNWLSDHAFISLLGEELDITIVGTCTDICVVSNALILKASVPAANITVIGSLCAGLTPESHEAALTVMKSCQINVK